MSDLCYRYRAADASGRPRRGEVLAAGEREAVRKVRALGLTPISVSRRGGGRGAARAGVGLEDLAALTRELAALVEAKVPVDRALRSIAEHEPRVRVAGVLRDVAGRLEAGASLTAALSAHGEVFGRVYIETLRAAERSGNLAGVMGHLADLLEKQVESRQQLRRALTYPAVVLCAVTLAVTVIVVFVVPKFGETFRAQGVQMPAVTRAIQAVGDSVRAHWGLYAGALAPAVLGAALWARTPRGRLAVEAALAGAPYLGRIVAAMTAARFARVLGLGLESGLDLIESIEVGARATGRLHFAREFEGHAERLRRGEPLGEVLAGTRTLPPFARRMLGTGKDAAEVARSCGIVARHYDREAAHLTKNISSAIEPLLTVAMAVVVLVVALSVFLPMWQMVRLNK